MKKIPPESTASADPALSPLLPDLSVGATALSALIGPWQQALAQALGTAVQAQSSAITPWLEHMSSREPSKDAAGDRRFDDPVWHSHPGYRMLAEAYLAWRQQVHAVIGALPTQGRQQEQLRGAADVLIDSLAPTNSLAGNPAAIRRAFETGGASLVAGWLQWVQDLLENQGMPAAVDATGFEVGHNLAATPGKVVLRHEMFELIQYTCARKAHRTPFLYVPPQINRYYMIDLAPKRSFMEYAVEQGFQPFVMSWRNPGPDKREWGMEAYVGAIIEAIDAVCEIAGTEELNLGGSCTGGITASAAAAVMRARGSTQVGSLTLMVSMIDTSVPTAFNIHSSPQSIALTKQIVGARGVMDGREMAAVFAWMRPNEMIWNNWVHNVLLGKKPPAFDMLVWNKDTTRLPARFHADLLDLGTENFLMHPGLRTMFGEDLDLSAIDVPLYIIGGLTDHIAPWPSCYAATRAMRGDATFVLGNGGHIQSIISPPGSRRSGYYTRDGAPPPSADDWLAGAVLNEGSWWPHWRDWLAARSGPRAGAAPRAGSQRHPPLCDAPGTYVFER